jgi:hypothetical protein
MNCNINLFTGLILLLLFSGIVAQESPEVIEAYRDDP